MGIWEGADSAGTDGDLELIEDREMEGGRWLMEGCKDCQGAGENSGLMRMDAGEGGSIQLS